MDRPSSPLNTAASRNEWLVVNVLLAEFFLLVGGFYFAQLFANGYRVEWKLTATDYVEMVFNSLYGGVFVIGMHALLFIWFRQQISTLISSLRAGYAPEKESDLREVTRLRESLRESTAENAERLLVMVEIDGRVRRLQKRTNIILLTISCSLVAAAFIVIFAGRLTSLDASAVSNIDRLNTEITASRRRLNNLYQLQGWHVALEEAKRKGVVSDIEKLEKQVPFLPRVEDGLTDPKAILASISAGERRMERLDDLLNDGWRRELSSERGYSDWKYIIATAITRLGVVVILVYLVQILMGLYRYNTRMIAYYNARRDIFTIWNGNPTTLKVLDNVLSTPTVDFGKEPKHPLEDILKTFGTTVREAASRKPKGVDDDKKL